jgi:hypothetical protein
MVANELHEDTSLLENVVGWGSPRRPSPPSFLRLKIQHSRSIFRMCGVDAASHRHDDGVPA